MTNPPPVSDLPLVEKIVIVWTVIYVIFTAATVAGVIVADAYSVWCGKVSVTEVIRELSHREPILVGLWCASHALLLGHLIWSR